MTGSSKTMDDAPEKTRCKHHEVCGRDEHAPGIGYCILHDPDEEKDQDAFNAAFAEHRDMLRARRDEAMRKEGKDYRPRRELRDNFRWMIFPGKMEFRTEIFPEEGVDFFRATFRDTADFNGAIFRDTSFIKATFRDTADFYEATFRDTADFSEATFRDTADFYKATFHDTADFLRTTFHDTAFFNDATFSDTAFFNEVTFRDTTDFSRGTFGDTANFYGATFRDKATFNEATFSDAAFFNKAIFRDTTDFHDATFSETTRFDETTFDSDVSFKQAHFEGRALFKGTRNQPLFSQKDKDEDEDAATVDFTNAEFHDRPKVRFLNVDLSRASFLHVDVREIEFTSVKWYKIDGGNGVYDEKTAQSKDGTLPYGALARLYRRLKQAYEDQRDYGRGGDFHYREKEMMWLDPNTSARTRVILTIYHALSGYGERYWAAGWFLGLVAACSVLSIIAGLDYTASEGLEWTLRWRLDDFFRSLVYSVQTAFVRPPVYMTPSNLWGEAVKVGTMILGPLLIGLFALAVRQRVRR